MLRFVPRPPRLESWESPLNSPIVLRILDPDEYRKRIRTLSDEELIKEGKTNSRISGDGKIVSTTHVRFMSS